MDQSELHAVEAHCTQEAMPRCRAACPLQMDVRAFMEHLAAGRARDARKLLERHLPLPAILIAVCDHPCENACLRRDLGGALEDMPRLCVTIGMKEILSARKIRLAVFRDWHRAVCRRAAYGEVTAAFPATLAQRHPDAVLYVNANAAQAAY